MYKLLLAIGVALIPATVNAAEVVVGADLNVVRQFIRSRIDVAWIDNHPNPNDAPQHLACVHESKRIVDTARTLTDNPSAGDIQQAVQSVLQAPREVLRWTDGRVGCTDFDACNTAATTFCETLLGIEKMNVGKRNRGCPITCGQNNQPVVQAVVICP